MFILTDQPFKEGDVVILGDGDWAQVRKIGMRTTRLFRFSDASIITVPNNRLVNEKIANFSNPVDHGRLMKTFNVAYGSDIGRVRKIISEVIEANPHILREEPMKPVIRFDAMSESSLDFFILVWLDSRDNRFAVTDYLNTEIYRRFNEAGIEIPFPQRTVHLRLANETLPESKTIPLDIERYDNEKKGSQGSRRGKGSPWSMGGRVMYEGDLNAGEKKLTLTETIGDFLDAIVSKPAIISTDATLREALDAILASGVTRKADVLDEEGRLRGTISVETLMRHIADRIGARSPGVISWLRFIRDMESDRAQQTSCRSRFRSRRALLLSKS